MNKARLVGDATHFRALREARAVFRLIRLALHLTYGIAIVALVYPSLGQKGRLGLKRRWSRQLLAALGMRLGAMPPAPEPGGELIVANHISWLDIFVINAVAPSVFVSKDDVKSWPVIGWLSERTETLFLERGSRRAAHRASEQMEECLRAGRRLALFPEGTTSDGSHVLPFHGALLQPAVDVGCMVQPVALRYLDGRGNPSKAPAYAGEITLWQSMRAISLASGLTAHSEFLAPIPASVGDRRHLAATLHRHIAHALGR